MAQLSDSLQLRLPDAAATEDLGAALARALSGTRGGVVWLQGDLGAGKTTLSRGLLRALGVRGAVRSPTYSLMEPYELDGHTVLHLDLYRLADADELWQLGLDSYPPETCLWLVEWPQRAAALLPPPLLRVELAHAGEQRCVRLSADPALLARIAAECPPGVQVFC